MSSRGRTMTEKNLLLGDHVRSIVTRRGGARVKFMACCTCLETSTHDTWWDAELANVDHGRAVVRAAATRVGVTPLEASRTGS